MLHVKVRRSLNFHFGAFTVLVFHTVIFLTLIHSCTGQHQVIGPSQPIVATVGGDIILPCHLEPAMDAYDMTVEWTRPDLDPRFVFVWRDGFELESKKHPSYEGRTSLFINELKLGNISLKLSKVKISDEGRYRCFIPGFRESTVQFVVGAASSPVIQMTKNSSGVDLRCESQGWYPEPEVFWLDGEGNLLSAGPTETVRGPDGLYTVSSRVTVDKRHSNSFTCRVQQKNINQTRETHIHVPDDFFPGPSSSSSSATIIGLVVGILFILAAVFVVWKWRQNRIRNKKHHEDEETQKVREKKRNSTSNNSEQESLMDREPDREQLTAERETVNDLDQFKEETGHETQTDNETRQRESNNVQCAVNKGTELQFSVEGGRQTDQRLAEGETENGLDKSEEETEAKPINERRDAPNPAARETESDLSNKEDETKSVSDNTEQPTGERQTENNLQTEEGEEEIKSTGDKTQVQCLMEEKHGEQLTAERETVNDLDQFKEETGLETQIDNETRQRESNIQCVVNKGTELQFSVEGGRQTDQRLAEGETENGLDKSEEETEAKPINERRDAPNPAARETESDLSNKEDETKSVSDNTEQPTGERQTENNLQTGEEEIKSTGDKTQVQCLMEEEEHGEQLTAERETPNDLDKEKETRMRKLKTKEREQKELKKKVSRVEEQMKQKEEQIKQLKLQLEEVERQREETQRKIHSVNMEEDEEEAAEEEKDEAVKLLSDTMNDLERRKAEVQKELQKMETLLERMKKEKMITTEKIMSLTLSREKTENHSDPEDL